MVKGKVAGIMIGGLAGYLLLSRVLSVVENCVRSACNAAEWRAYYKHGNENTVPPGYRSVTRKVDPEHEFCVEDPTQVDENGNLIDNSEDAKKAAISESIKKAINSCFDGVEAAEGAKNPEKTASEEDICEESENPVTDIPVNAEETENEGVD